MICSRKALLLLLFDCCLEGCYIILGPVTAFALQVLTNAGQANAATGDQGYEDAVTCARTLADALHITPDDVLLMSTGKGNIKRHGRLLACCLLCGCALLLLSGACCQMHSVQLIGSLTD